jgi:hypothetical protein
MLFGSQDSFYDEISETITRIVENGVDTKITDFGSEITALELVINAQTKTLQSHRDRSRP